MSIAEKLQTLAENEQRISAEVGDQADLIAQITSVIDEKLAGGGEEPVNKLAGVVDGTVTELTAEDLAGATSIRTYAFYYCSNLTSIEIPDGIKVIGGSAFYDCSKLRSVVIPDSVTSVGTSVFQRCSALTSVVIGNGVMSISSSMFSTCSSLTSIEIPNRVTSIGSSAFYDCKKLKSIEIPDSVTSIGNNAFNGCYDLTSVVIGNGVTTIDSAAFIYDRSLKRVDFSKHTQVPTLKSSVFASTHADLQIKVPANLIDSWKTATNWSNYADKIVTEFTNEV